MSSSSRKRPELKPLKLWCGKSDCENGLHCFRQSKRRAKRASDGSCQACGLKTVDWDRVNKRDPADVVRTVSELKKEWIRHEYWCRDIDPHARNYALRKGKRGLLQAVPKKLRSALQVNHPREGQQTPWEGNIICYAQHATACCCRNCLDYWHGIPLDQPLSEEHVRYLSDLCLRFIFERVPDLPEDGQYVPGIRRAKGAA